MVLAGQDFIILGGAGGELGGGSRLVLQKHSKYKLLGVFRALKNAKSTVIIIYFVHLSTSNYKKHSNHTIFCTFERSK